MTQFLIDSVSDMLFGYTFFLVNFACLFIYLYISSVLLYYYYLYLVSVDRLAKRRIFFLLFSKNLTLRA